MIGVREPQPAASEAFVKFADAHRSIEKFGIRLLKTIKPVGRVACTCVSTRGGEGTVCHAERSWRESECLGAGSAGYLHSWCGEVPPPPWPWVLTSRLVCGPSSTTELQLALSLVCLLTLERGVPFGSDSLVP